jgi:CRP-like cAMP-binding protein
VSSDLAAAAARLPLYDGLGEAELAEMAAGLSRQRFINDAALMTQGEAANGAYFVANGGVRVLTKLPGGGETLIAEAGAGSLLGELALIRPAPRSATVRAHGTVDALFAERRHFTATLSQHRPLARKLLRNLLVLLTRRIDRTHRKIASLIATAPPPGSLRPPPARSDTSPDGFDVRRFLAILPTLADFDTDERHDLRALAEVETLPRGTPLDPDDGAALVVRGAVLAALPHGERLHQVQVLGPGAFCTLDRQVEATAMTLHHVVQEDATLLRFADAACRRLIDGNDRLAQQTLHAFAAHQAAMLVRADQHLTRLVGLGRLHQQHDTSDPVVV